MTKEKCKKRIIILLLAIVLVTLIGYIIAYPDQMITNTVVTTSYDVASSSETISKISLQNDMEWLQTLTFSENGFLDNVKIKITEVPDNISGSIKFIILDEDRVPLYTEEISCQRLNDGTYYQMSGFTEVTLGNMNIKVKKGEILFLSCMIENNEADAPMLTVFRRKSDIKLWINGVLQKDEMLRMNYGIIKKGQYYGIAIVLIEIIGLLIYLIRKKEKVFYKSACIIEVVLPFFILLLFVWLNENPTFIKSIYMLTSVVLLYVIYLLLIGLLNIKIGETLFIAISLVVTLGNYYVQDFRG